MTKQWAIAGTSPTGNPFRLTVNAKTHAEAMTRANRMAHKGRISACVLIEPFNMGKYRRMWGTGEFHIRDSR